MVDACLASERLLYWLKGSACDFGFEDFYPSEVSNLTYITFNLLPHFTLLLKLLLPGACKCLMLLQCSIPFLFRRVLFPMSYAGYWGFNYSAGLQAVIGMYSTHIAAFTVLREQHPYPSLTDQQLSMHLFEINVLFAAFLTQIGIQQVTRLFVEIPGNELVNIQQLLLILIEVSMVLVCYQIKEWVLSWAMWLSCSFYTRDIAIWIISFTVVFAYKSDFQVALYFLAKLLVALPLALHLISNSHLQVLETSQKPGIPLRICEMDFPAPIKRRIINTVLVNLTCKVKLGENRKYAALLLQQYCLWTDSIQLVSEENRRNLTHSLSYFPSFLCFLGLFRRERSLAEWGKLKRDICELLGNCEKDPILSGKLRAMSAYVEQAEHRSVFLWISGSPRCKCKELPRDLRLLVADFF